ncbi:hypothetical protein IU471_07005 [Nocardia elegans]|uniref:hypothetical protein n=1 Tax=Nocardia elegans TaxID=300029 RepID=UPI001895885B|nr:hypothetical protein [Nocardia elegans]MBF6243330.1 hypothetical protein [Nocardia elegans]
MPSPARPDGSAHDGEQRRHHQQHHGEPGEDVGDLRSELRSGKLPAEQVFGHRRGVVLAAGVQIHRRGGDGRHRGAASAGEQIAARIAGGEHPGLEGIVDGPARPRTEGMAATCGVAQQVVAEIVRLAGGVEFGGQRNRRGALTGRIDRHTGQLNRPIALCRSEIRGHHRQLRPVSGQRPHRIARGRILRRGSDLGRPRPGRRRHQHRDHRRDEGDESGDRAQRPTPPMLYAVLACTAPTWHRGRHRTVVPAPRTSAVVCRPGVDHRGPAGPARRPIRNIAHGGRR